VSRSGASLAVALMADISIMAGEAKITDGHVRIGVSPGDHAVILWPLLCGRAKAKYYLMTPDFGDGKEAERIGLVNLCAPHARLMERAYGNGGQAGEQQSARDPYTKRSLNNWMRTSQPVFDASLAREMLCFLGDERQGSRGRAEEKRETPVSLPSDRAFQRESRTDGAHVDSSTVSSGKINRMPIED